MCLCVSHDLESNPGPLGLEPESLSAIPPPSVSVRLRVCVSVCPRGFARRPRGATSNLKGATRGQKGSTRGQKGSTRVFVSIFVDFCRFLSIFPLVGRFLHSWTPLGLSWHLPDRSWDLPDLSRTAPRVDVGAIQLLPPPPDPRPSQCSSDWRRVSVTPTQRWRVTVSARQSD